MIRRLYAIWYYNILYLFRIRIITFLISFFLVVISVLPFILSGDGTLKGRIQLVITYMGGIAFIILSIINIFLGSNLLRKEWKEKQLFLLETKPLKRWEIFLGKLGAIFTLNGLLLLFTFLFTLIAIKFMVNNVDSEIQKEETLQTVLNCRAKIMPEENELMRKARKNKRKNYSVLYRQEIVLKFKGLEGIRQNDIIILRYKVNSSVEKENAIWEFGSNSSYIYRFPVNLPTKKKHEIYVPGYTVDKDGTLIVKYVNLSNKRATVLFPLKDGIVIFVKKSSVYINFLKGMIMMFFLVIFLSSISLMASTFVSSPVSILVGFAFFIFMLSANFIEELFTPFSPNPQSSISISYIYGKICSRVIKVITPNFAKYEPISFLNNGIMIPLTKVLVSILEIGIRICIILGVGNIIFSSIEIGDIQDNW